MSKHEELIERLRCFDRVTCNEAADAIEAQAREIEGLQAARRAYASEFPLDSEGEPNVGSIHQNIRAMKAEIEGLRKALTPFAAYEHVRSTMGGTTPKEGVLWGCHSRAGSAEITVEDMQAAIDAAKGAAK